MNEAQEETKRTYWVRTFGCQMNLHDSEKIENLLHHNGFRPAAAQDEAELVLINTCSIREKAENRLYTDLGLLRDWKSASPNRVLGVGGCVAQQEGDALLRRFSHLDFVFGTHNLRLVPTMADAARRGQRSARTEEHASLDRFELPARHPDFAGRGNGHAFVTVMEGCDMFCTFCIVPRTRGREISRPAASIVEEVANLARRGVREITLLGQTVNAYGRHDARRSQSEAAGTVPFAALVRQLSAVPGIERIRYTSPHPIFFDADLVAAHAEVEALCPHVHLPVQSGSDAVLAQMRRRYTCEEYLRRVDALRAARPDIAITTDLIVGFPGETDTDFRATLDLMQRVGFVDSFSFKYSPRPGTQAVELGDVPPPDVAQARLAELQELQRELTLAHHRARVGQETVVRVEGESHRRGGKSVYGRDPYHRVVNIPGELAPGLFAEVRIVEATPHSLIGEAISPKTAAAA